MPSPKDNPTAAKLNNLFQHPKFISLSRSVLPTKRWWVELRALPESQWFYGTTRKEVVTRALEALATEPSARDCQWFYKPNIEEVRHGQP